MQEGAFPKKCAKYLDSSTPAPEAVPSDGLQLPDRLPERSLEAGELEEEEEEEDEDTLAVEDEPRERVFSLAIKLFIDLKSL